MGSWPAQQDQGEPWAFLRHILFFSLRPAPPAAGATLFPSSLLLSYIRPHPGDTSTLELGHFLPLFLYDLPHFQKNNLLIFLLSKHFKTHLNRKSFKTNVNSSLLFFRSICILKGQTWSCITTLLVRLREFSSCS